jgi:hypothetical protein
MDENLYHTAGRSLAVAGVYPYGNQGRLLFKVRIKFFTHIEMVVQIAGNQYRMIFKSK